MGHAFESQISMTHDRWAIDLGLPKSILEKVGWGIGFGLQKNNQGQVVRAFHSGDMSNLRAFVGIDLENKTGAVFFSDSPNGLVLAETLISPVVEVSGGLEYINKKYGFEISCRPNFSMIEKANFKKN